MDWLAGRKLIEGSSFRDIIAVPQGETLPELWMLGSSNYGAQLAGYLGLPYCFAHFITQGAGAAQAMDVYRRVFRPGVLAAPHAAVTVWALAAETQAEAERLFSSRAIWWLGHERGVFAPLPSPDEAAEYVLNDAERATIERMRARAIYGTPDVVVAKLRALAAELGVQELALLTTVHHPAARRRSYALIMREWGTP